MTIPVNPATRRVVDKAMLITRITSRFTDRMRTILIYPSLAPMQERLIRMSGQDAALPCATIEGLYQDHHQWLRAWLRRRLGNAADAADLAHDTFERLLNVRGAFVGATEPRAYLTTTAKRLLVDRLRRAALEQAYLQELAALAHTLCSYPSPDQILAAVDALDEITRALAGLPSKAQEAFLRHYLDDQPQAVIAADLGVSKRMVQKYLAQAIFLCRQECPALTAHPCA
ncbi:sigma-70 family RNA polymerase sigma factor [Pigmentiphaga litoralis]|uniref:sigma-70 family RNA polymerase sigma factor n=1 Tax=Pigmentiphaga litoralis TaxID=516702 RepID=UPI003B43146F